ncbi:preprotein translocase subunit SecG [Eubacterium oxidoreducens]|uniref:Protein-export membrane protein SecG n=1 Tax=Eubacterium oxidoreducens TaxID=1732 RepID=A0A1G6B6W6_EUBOX|nr:preprotein translocase subunit SecG [Eubacterium oxidoreducens]SDB16319.1 preprotein translocase subunit SecG [Eubacterium oxidoreducens]
MDTLKIILIIVLIAVCAIGSIIILMQEGKQNGLGALSGSMTSNDSYWSKNKGRSKEGTLVKITTLFVVLFMGISLVLSMGFFN